MFESVENKPRLYGDFVVINGRAHVTVNLDGKEQTFDLSYTDVFVKRDGRFQMIAWQSTRLPDAAPATRTEDGARSTVLARFDAALRGDVAALDRLLADDLDYCTFRGDCETKAQYLGELQVRPPQICFDRAHGLQRQTIRGQRRGAGPGHRHGGTRRR